MFWHLVLTDDCNLCCTYCRAKAFEEDEEPAVELRYDSSMPAEIELSLDDLASFLARDPEPTVTFYGGEPLLRLDVIAEVLTRLPRCRFMVQTNGTLLDRVPPALAARFHTILVSIDGPEALTDTHRGHGVYRNVVRNLEALVEGGFLGEVIARMTVDEATEIEEAVLHCDALPCTAVHWQLDANFSGDHRRRDFERWAECSYNPGIRALAEHWVERMAEGTVPRWYPFLDLTEDLLFGRSSRLRCGAGHANYTIQTDGMIVPCPIMTGLVDFYLGHIRDADPLALPEVPVGRECSDCDIASFCGGRCLYASVARPWPPAGRAAVCDTVGNLRAALVSVLPRIRELLEADTIALDDFVHLKFNGCEIIP
jgi:putative peptide-modifying radical SAM enzyme